MHLPRRIALWLPLVTVTLGPLGGCGSDTTAPVSIRPRTGPAQTLQIVGGVGSLAYFQLMWPHVEIAQADDSTFATIEPASAGFLIPGDSSGNKEWFATSYAPWIDENGKPFPSMEISAFVSGTIQTHTMRPTSNNILTGWGLPAAIATRQSTTRTVPSPLVVQGNPFIGNAPGAPNPQQADDADEMIALYQASGNVDLTPTAGELVLFDVANAPTPWLAEFGRQMIVAAKALRQDLSNTIVVALPGLDPHGAFNDIPETQAILTSLQTILNGFYTLLADQSHADDVLICVLGDTPKTPLNRNGWPDSTPGGCNWVYVVAKGLLKNGWFGRVHADGSVSSYDPTTGADDPNAACSSTEKMTAAAIAYAAMQRDHAYLDSVMNGGPLSDYEGVVLRRRN